jgi:NAD(P)-dependent dehydrogenase (short-subunit alcohol dehydrogenase family)
MLTRGGGSMIYTSSASAYMGEPVRLAYAMSKASLHALMRHVAAAFGPKGIRANVIAPGVMWHPKLEQYMTPEVVAGFKAANLLKTRLGTPGDIAAMAALLMADEGAYITGQSISVDGGRTLRP